MRTAQDRGRPRAVRRRASALFALTILVAALLPELRAALGAVFGHSAGLIVQILLPVTMLPYAIYAYRHHDELELLDERRAAADRETLIPM
jgi:hypothetical protein